MTQQKSSERNDLYPHVRIYIEFILNCICWLIWISSSSFFLRPLTHSLSCHFSSRKLKLKCTHGRKWIKLLLLLLLGNLDWEKKNYHHFNPPSDNIIKNSYAIHKNTTYLIINNIAKLCTQIHTHTYNSQRRH